MKRFIKIQAAASVLCISILLQLLQLTVGAAAFLYSDRYSTPAEETIGWHGCPVAVSAGGSFTAADGGTAGFGAPKYALLSRDSSGYPILTHTFEVNNVFYTLTQFVCQVDAGGKSCICVYSQLDAENSSDIDEPLLTPDERLYPLGDTAAAVPAGGSVLCCYVTPVQNGDGITKEELQAAGTYSEHEQQMKAYWDAYTESGCFGGGEGLPEGMYEVYRAQVTDDAINGRISPLSVYEGRNENITGEADPFSVFLFIGRNGGSADFGIEAAADKITEGIRAFSPADSSDEIWLYSTDGALPPAEDCFEALVQLAACIETAPACGVSEEKVGKYKEAYQKLLEGTETAFLRAVSAAEYSWEITESSADREELRMALDPETTAEALCSRYIRCAAMGRFDSDRLALLAKEALCGMTAFSDPALSALAALQISADGSIYIGRGLSPEMLTQGSISVRTSGAKGESVQVKISAEGDTVTVDITAPAATPVSVAMPFFKGRIKNASCSYDNDSGTVTPDPGSSSVRIRLDGTVSETGEKYRAAKMLESALFKASLADTDGCTTISVREFEAARKNALGARSADISGGERIEDAEELEQCCAALSKMTSGYTFLLGGLNENSAAANIPVGTNGIIQKLTLPKDGTLTRLYLNADKADKISAAVYALDNDGYTLKKELAVSEGKADGDGRVKFEFELDMDGGVEYAVKLTADGEDGTVRAANADNTRSLYRDISGEAEIYPNLTVAVSADIVQADRSELDAFYEKCHNTNVSQYTRESVKQLQNAMQSSAALLRTPDAQKDECADALADMQKAYSGLSTYASDRKADPPSPVLYILIAATVVLLCVALVSASSAGKQKKKK